MDFQEFPKIGRLSRDMVITEKIDGTNAQIAIVKPDDTSAVGPLTRLAISVDAGTGLVMLAGSRSQWITPERDNHGFARWVMDHARDLFALGEGRHFGEWWGQGIQRRYGLNEKRFSLFNVGRWVDTHTTNGDELLTGKQQYAPACCHVVPVIMRWTFSEERIAETLDKLRTHGSYAAPGFMNPEGIIVFHSASGAMFKKTLERDDEPKSRTQSDTVGVFIATDGAE